MDLTTATYRISRTKQTLLALAVLGGVLLMHGVAADHVMPTMSHGSTASAHTPTVAVHAEHELAAVDGTELSQVSALWSSPANASHLMVGGCIAVLSTWLLMALLGLRSRSIQTRTSGLSRPPRLRRGNNAAASLWLLAPSLTRLGIART